MYYFSQSKEKVSEKIFFHRRKKGRRGYKPSILESVYRLYNLKIHVGNDFQRTVLFSYYYKLSSNYIAVALGFGFLYLAST